MSRALTIVRFRYYAYYAEVGAFDGAKSNKMPKNPKPIVDEVTIKEEYKGKIEVIKACQYPQSKTEEKVINLENGETE